MSQADQTLYLTRSVSAACPPSRADDGSVSLLLKVVASGREFFSTGFSGNIEDGQHILLAMLLAVVLAEPAKVRKILNDFPDRVSSVAFYHDSKVLATSTDTSDGDNNAVRLWDLATGKEICCVDKYRRGEALSSSLLKASCWPRERVA